ncbi:zinc finger protein 431-like [Anopheles maculipalpis]|uniref:zinc finger protein 431-like n=1 Tax=Anopheles maculipalpis TaxID=1496333 RepID=UPI002159A703|nr:zinc finger protein 431-like [Anopheles maculipalpis]
METDQCEMDFERIFAKLPDVCRVCFSEDSDSKVDLYHIDDVYVKPTSVEHMSSFRAILAVFVNDEFESHGELIPTSICADCSARAQSAFQFVEQCQRSDQLLEQYFKSVEEDKILQIKSDDSLIAEELSHEQCQAQEGRTSLHVTQTYLSSSEQKRVKKKAEIQGKKSPKGPTKSNNNRWYCDTCDKSFSQPQTLRRHSRIHDQTGSSKIDCERCGRQFLRSDDLTRHMRTHTGERPYECQLCSKTYKQGNELKEHLLTHSREKHFKCTECSKQFSSRNGLYVHLKVHRGEKPHACPHCDKRFTTSSERISHVRHVHSAQK